MTGIKPSSHGIVVEHKESGVRYAVSDKNYNEKIHRKVRDLKPGETVRGYQPKRSESLSAGSEASEATSAQAGDSSSASGDSEVVRASSVSTPKTEGSAPADAQG
jgi:hypothetical protein